MSFKQNVEAKGIVSGFSGKALPTLYITGVVNFLTTEPDVSVKNTIYVHTGGDGNSSSTSQSIQQNRLYRSNGVRWVELPEYNIEGTIITVSTTGVSYRKGALVSDVWTPISAEVLSTIIDTSSSVYTETLPAATGSGTIKYWVLQDKTNNASLSVQLGESLAGVLNGTFTFSNYEVGTQFQATDRALGFWEIAIIGQSTGKDRLLYSTRGISVFDMASNTVGGITTIQLDSMFPSTVNSGGSFTVEEIDNLSIRAGNVLTIPSKYSGVYEVDISIIHDDTNIADGIAAVNSTTGSNRAGLRINGNVQWLVLDDGSGLPDVFDRSSSFFLNLNEGDTIELVINSDGAGGNEEFITFFKLKQVYSTDVILAGMVQPTSLHNARFSLSADSAGIICPFNATDYNEDTSKYVLEASGGVTVQPGKYLVTVKPGRQGGLLDWELWNSTSSSQVMQGRLDHAGGIDNTDHATTYLNITSASEIQLRELNGDFSVTWNGNVDLYGCTIEFVELPTSTVVIPDALDVENIRVVEKTVTTGLAFDTTYSLDNSRTWNDLKADYEFIEFNYVLRVTGLTEDVTQTIKVKASDLVDSSYHRITYGAGFASMSPASLTTGDFSWPSSQSGGLDSIGIEIVGVKAQKTVINTIDTPTNDQASSGYYDIGNMRIQWGEGEGANLITGTVSLPALFANTTYSLVGTSNGNDTAVDHGVQLNNRTTTSFGFTKKFGEYTSTTNGAYPGTFSWQAIGLKP